MFSGSCRHYSVIVMKVVGAKCVYRVIVIIYQRIFVTSLCFNSRKFISVRFCTCKIPAGERELHTGKTFCFSHYGIGISTTPYYSCTQYFFVQSKYPFFWQLSDLTNWNLYSSDLMLLFNMQGNSERLHMFVTSAMLDL